MRLHQLDALRGLAILGVLIVHLAPLALGPGWAQTVTGFGARGVQLFFIVSAFTLLTVNRDLPAGAFFIRRFFRIAPMFYLGILGYLWLYGLGPRHFAPDGIGPVDIGLTATFLHTWTPNSATSVVPGGWSIGTEALFYAAFPLLVLVVTSLRRAIVFFALSSLTAAALYVVVPRLAPGPLAQDYAFFLFPSQLPAFAVGFVVYFAHQRFKAPAWLPYAALGLVLALALSASRLAHFHLVANVALGLLAFGIISAPPSLLVNTPMMQLGTISYSVYIVHFALIEAAKTLGLPGPLAVAFGAGASLAVAAMTYRWIERPTIRLGHALSERLVATPRLAPR